MATVAIANTTANISGKTVVLAERDHTITGSWTFSRSPSAPFTVTAASAVVTNLDADKLDGLDSTYFTNATNLASGTVPTARQGTGTASVETFLRGDQTWATPFGQVCQGRLTLTTATPVTTADVTAAVNVFFTPYGGNRIAVYNGTNWKLFTFTELTLAVGTLTSGLPYDVFVFDNSGTLTLESLAWTSTSARATALVLQDGVLVKSGVTTRRYLGTFYTSSTTTTEDSAAKRYLFNYYNRMPRLLEKTIAGSTTWNYTTATIRQANNGTGTLQVDVMVGFAEAFVDLTLQTVVLNASAVSVQIGIGVDSTTTMASPGGYMLYPGASNPYQLVSRYQAFPTLGKHTYSWNEWSQAAGTTTWNNSASGANNSPGGISGSVLA